MSYFLIPSLVLNCHFPSEALTNFGRFLFAFGEKSYFISPRSSVSNLISYKFLVQVIFYSQCLPPGPSCCGGSSPVCAQATSTLHTPCSPWLNAYGSQESPVRPALYRAFQLDPTPLFPIAVSYPVSALLAGFLSSAALSISACFPDYQQLFLSPSFSPLKPAAVPHTLQ